MSGREEIEKLVREAYRRRVAEDVAGTCDLFTQDAKFRFASEPRSAVAPFAATDQPKLREQLTQIVKAFDLKDFKLQDVIVDGDRAVAHWRATVRFTPTGREADTEVVDVFEIRDGKIAAFTEFCDTALVERLTAAA
jgi:ketosteroid isomerase-like protein